MISTVILKGFHMTDKIKLKKLVEIFDEILKIKENEWLVDDLLRMIEKNFKVNELAKNSIIREIHEHCIEQVTENQAKDFYKDFPMEKIKNSLIIDFKKMEHERRRDDFYNFGLCLYQQIENITQHLFLGKDIQVLYEKNQNKIINDKKQQTLNSLIFRNSGDKFWYPNKKFVAILYFVVYKEDMQPRNYYSITDLSFNFDEVYQIRNMNHRGGEQTEFQRKIVERIQNNESSYYLKFYGFLNRFVVEIKNSFI